MTPPYQYDASSNLNALNYYSVKPNVLGFHFSDEPEEEMFQVLGQYRQALNTYSNNLFFFVNLFPQYANMNQLFGSGYSPNNWPTDQDYYNYIEEYITQTGAPMLLYDHYAIMNKTSSSFYSNAYHVISLCNIYDRKFMPVISTWGNKLYGNPKIFSEFSEVIHSQLAYGAKGLVYWTREGAGDRLNPSYNSQPLDNIASSDKLLLTALHQQLYLKRHVFNDLTYQGSYHFDNDCTYNNSGYQKIPVDNEWNMQQMNSRLSVLFPYTSMSLSNIFQPVVVTLNNLFFSHLTDSKSNDYTYFVNKDPYTDLEFTVKFSADYYILDILNNELTRTNFAPVSIKLEKGEGKLFQVSKLIIPNKSICTSLPSGNIIDEVANTIEIGSSSCTTVIQPNSHTAFKAEVININYADIKSGSTVQFTAFEGELNSGKKIQDSDDIEERIKVFPNPSDGNFQVRFDSQTNWSVAVYNSNGHLVAEKFDIDEAKVNLDLDILSSGLYLVRVKNEKETFEEKVLIQH